MPEPTSRMAEPLPRGFEVEGARAPRGGAEETVVNVGRFGRARVETTSRRSPAAAAQATLSRAAGAAPRFGQQQPGVRGGGQRKRRPRPASAVRVADQWQREASAPGALAGDGPTSSRGRYSHELTRAQLRPVSYTRAIYGLVGRRRGRVRSWGENAEIISGIQVACVKNDTQVGVRGHTLGTRGLGARRLTEAGAPCRPRARSFRLQAEESELIADS